jgi:hypothetical protein
LLPPAPPPLPLGPAGWTTAGRAECEW